MMGDAFGMDHAGLGPRPVGRGSGRAGSSGVRRRELCRLGEFELVPGVVLHAEIAVTPRLAHNVLHDPRATTAQFFVQLLELLRKYVQANGRLIQSGLQEQVDGDVVTFEDGVVALRDVGGNLEAELILVIVDGPAQIVDGKFRGNPGELCHSVIHLVDYAGMAPATAEAKA